MTRIAIIVGSTRPNAVGHQVGDWVYGRAAQRTDAEFELIRVADQNLPLLDEPHSPSTGKYTKPHTLAWAKKIAEYDGYVFVSAEYNHSVPGALKNAFDFLYQEWVDKSVAVVSYGAAGGLRAAEHWRTIFANASMVDVRGQVSLFFEGDFTKGPTLSPREFQLATLDDMLGQVVTMAQRLAATRS